MLTIIRTREELAKLIEIAKGKSFKGFSKMDSYYIKQGVRIYLPLIVRITEDTVVKVPNQRNYVLDCTVNVKESDDDMDLDMAGSTYRMFFPLSFSISDISEAVKDNKTDKLFTSVHVVSMKLATVEQEGELLTQL